MQENTKTTTIPWGCLGAVISAVIMGIVTIFITVKPSSILPSASFENKLRVPIQIYVNGTYDTEISSGYSKKIILESVPAKISIQSVNLKNSSGEPIGDSIRGSYNRVFGGENFIIRNETSDQLFFFPVLSNATNTDCKIIINEGLPSEKSPGILLARTSNIILGYYKWFSDSNIALHCEDAVFYWGMYYGAGESISKFTDHLTGELHLTLTQP